MAEDEKKDPWYHRWLGNLHPTEHQESRKERRRNAMNIEVLNQRIAVLLEGYFDSMDRYEKVIDEAHVDVNTRQELLEQHRELVLKGLDTGYRDWLRLHPKEYVYDQCAGLFVARVVELYKIRHSAN